MEGIFSSSPGACWQDCERTSHLLGTRLKFYLLQSFPRSVFFYILLYDASFPSKNPLVAGSAALASCRGLSSTHVLQQGWSISAFGSASAPLLAARGKGKCQGEPVPSAGWLIGPYLLGAFSDGRN